MRPTARGLPSSETKVPFDEPSCPSLLPAQHRRAGAGEAEGPWTLPLSPSCTAAAGGSHPLAPSLSPSLGSQAWPCRHHPQHSTVPVLHHLSWPCVHPVPRAGVFGGSGLPDTSWPCTGSSVSHSGYRAAAWGPVSSPGWALCEVPGLPWLTVGWLGQGWLCPPGLSPACATALPCHPRSLWSCVPGSVCCVPAPRHLPWAYLPVPFNSNNGQASAAAAHCLPIPLRLPAAGRSPGTGERRAGHCLPLCPWHSPQPGQGPRPQSLLWGAALGPLCSAPGQGCRCCWLGLSGSASASTAPALPASCLCWAAPSIPAALAPRRALPPLGDNPFCSPLEPFPLLPLPRGLGASATSPFAVHRRTPGPWCRLPPAPAMDGATGRGPQDYFSITTFWCTVIFSCNLISRELPPEPVFNLMDVDITLERLSY